MQNSTKMKRVIQLLTLLVLVFVSCGKEGDNNASISYSLGDLVEVEGVKGVVFYKDDVVTKIVSVDEIQLAWSTEYVVANATDLSNGASNMALIKAIDGWEDKYPAFKWCADCGDGWYLPAQSELLGIYNQRSVVNATLEENGFAKLDIGDNAFYWSSTEATRIAAGGIFFNSGKDYNYMKSTKHSLRAILVL